MTETSDLHSRVELAVRRNHGIRLREAFIARVAVSVRRPVESIELVDLPASDVVFERFSREFALIQEGTSSHRTWSIESADVEAVRRALAATRVEFENVPIYLFCEEWKFCGAVRSTAHEVLDHAFDLLDENPDGIVASEEVARAAILFDRSTDPPDHAETYELLAWQ
jgi:hypothetical protein